MHITQLWDGEYFILVSQVTWEQHAHWLSDLTDITLLCLTQQHASLDLQQKNTSYSDSISILLFTSLLLFVSGNTMSVGGDGLGESLQ